MNDVVNTLVATVLVGVVVYLSACVAALMLGQAMPTLGDLTPIAAWLALYGSLTGKGWRADD